MEQAEKLCGEIKNDDDMIRVLKEAARKINSAENLISMVHTYLEEIIKLPLSDAEKAYLSKSRKYSFENNTKESNETVKEISDTVNLFGKVEDMMHDLQDMAISLKEHN